MPKPRLVVLAAILAIGTSACVRSSTHKKVLNELKACQGDLNTCTNESAAKDVKITGLETSLLETRKQLDRVTGEKEQAETELADLSKNLEATQEELGELRKAREATERRLKAFKDLTERFRALVDTGKLEVVFRSGQMVLKLPAGILFPSGKAKLSDEGEEALAEVTAILLEFKDRRFVIAGHTDDRKIRTRKFKDNWDLSVARAVSVVRFMIENGFDPKNIGAAGYGEYDPVASNETKETRALNRRIEIVLVPDLSELPTLKAEPEKKK